MNHPPTRSKKITRMHYKLHALVLEAMLSSDMTVAQLAKRIGTTPKEIVRWMSSPANLTLYRVSDLLLGMGLELKFGDS